MRKWLVLLAALMLLVIPLSVCAGVSDNGRSDNDISGRLNSGTSDSSYNPGNGDRIQDQDRLNNQTRDQDRLQNQTHILNATQLHDQIRERVRELDSDQMNLSRDRQQLLNQYNNESAFVYMLQNQSDQFGGIGPQLSQYSTQVNNSLQVEIQAQERIQSRNVIVRFFAGGDEAAAGDLQQETLRIQQRIQEMQQLIEDCSCDPQIRALLQQQLQRMEQQQIQLQQLAQKELQDKGLIGWLWK